MMKKEMGTNFLKKTSLIKEKRATSRFQTININKLMPVSKRSQVTIFIILALAIVLVLLLIFLGRDRIGTLITGESPVEQIRRCVAESFEPALDLIRLQGGSLAPEHYYLYQGNKLDYLCYTEENYKQCVMQKPLLKQSIERELETYLQPRARNCIESVKSSLQGKGYAVSSKNPVIDIQLIPNSILIDVKSDLRISKDITETHESIKVDTNSKLYEHVMVASSISNWEAKYGDSETMNYMIYYPDLKVEKKKQGDGTTVYILSDRGSLEKFMFASRSIVVPAGITGT